VDRVLQTGPGIREMEGLLALAYNGQAWSQSHGRLLSGLMVLARGPFAAVPDCGPPPDPCHATKPQGRLSLSEVCTRQDTQQLVESKVRQADLAYQELRSKLALGVQEAREAIVSGREQLRLARAQIDHASRAYELANLRLKKLGEQGGGSIADVLQTIRGLELAHVNYLSVVSAYDKAQLRLLLFLGPSAGTAADCHISPRAGP
jgi:hypothetical protein